MQLGEEQKRAVEMICSRARLGIVTGGPGTGKTTVLKMASAALASSRRPFMLLAPTGKAARRISEVTSLEASTIHRALASSRDGTLGGTIIIDEASMVDLELFAKVVRSTDISSRIILIGDANQLPSVAPGRVFGDLIETGAIPVVRLLEVHRSARDSWVCTNAPEILQGNISLEAKDDFTFIEAKSHKEVEDAVLRVYRELEDKGSSQILSPQNRGPCSTGALNRMLQEDRAKRKRPYEVNLGSFEKPFWLYSGDPVVQTKNNYRTQVFNGEIGTVILPEEDRGVPTGMIGAQFDSRIVHYAYDDVFKMLKQAYVLTIHKSQGSEWDTIVLVCHTAHQRMWSRQLLYTAVTRAKKKVIIIGERAAVRLALQNDQPANRRTTLKQRIEEED